MFYVCTKCQNIAVRRPVTEIYVLIVNYVVTRQPTVLRERERLQQVYKNLKKESSYPPYTLMSLQYFLENIPLRHFAHMAHYFSRGVPVTLQYSGFLRNHPEHFRCPNIAVQYINLYVSTISRLLVMSVITSWTPNKLRYIKIYKLIMKLSS